MWGRIVSSVSSALDLNHATLSGCGDIIVVPQDDEGTLKSSPFHVRFGKSKVLRSREKIVTVHVNRQATPLRMQLGPAGEAYFIHETVEPSDIGCRSRSPSPCSDHGGSFDYSNPPYTLTGEDMEGEEQGKLAEEALAQVQNVRSKYGDMASSRIAFSLCSHLLYGTEQEKEHDHSVFEANKIGWDELNADPLLWYHQVLVVRFDDTPPYYSAKIALPLIISWLVFNRPLSIEAVDRLVHTTIVATEQRDSSWKSWFSASENQKSDNKLNSSQSSITAKISTDEIGSAVSSDASSDEESHITADPNVTVDYIDGKKVYTRRTLRPTSAQLLSLNLKPGPNLITFTASSALQGTKSIQGTIYLWPRNAKLIVSDVDGTITKSDVLGLLMPIVGKDWSHTGVAELYSKIEAAGYYMVYLTARAIGQADTTRDYLFALTQGTGCKLPDGPLFLSPDRVFPSMKREVIDRKPYAFKIACLRDIRNLFPASNNPFYAGFGNRDTDHRAYVHSGIPEGKVFIVDTHGILHHTNAGYATSYEKVAEIADFMFPPVKRDDAKQEESEVNSFRMYKKLDFIVQQDTGGCVFDNILCNPSAYSACYRPHKPPGFDQELVVDQV